MPNFDETDVATLERKIALAESERNAWKGKSAHHYRMGTLLVEALKKQLRELLQGRDTRP